MNDNLDHQPIAWTPSAEVIDRAQLTKFMSQVGLQTWDELYQFSINDVERYTAEVLKFLDIKFDPPYQQLLDTSNGLEWSKWCIGGGLNISEMCLDRWMGTEIENQPAIIWEGEGGETQTISYENLTFQVRVCANGLKANGFSKGDAIGIHLPMIPYTVIALLAIARIGAIAVPVFSGYGIDAISSRLNAVGAKGLITCLDFPRRGKKVTSLEVAIQAAKTCSTIQQVFFAISSEKDISRISEIEACKFEGNFEVKFFDYLFGNGITAKEIDKDFTSFEPTSANDPLIILYTSGTTGKPKGIAHVHCGFPLKAAEDMAFGTDVGKGTRISWVTDLGWMMGPWLIYGALINGATMVLYDGSPDYPNPDRMWEFCAKHKVEILGISPTLVRGLATKGDELPKKHDLSSLRAFASTGEPWNPEPWRWLFEVVGDSRLPIINYSGGTEISGGILMNNPLLPIKPCGFSAPCLGIDADILNEKGESVENGKVGELAIKQTWLGMAQGFWNEPERYLETYWNRFEDIWVHGDFALKDEDGHWFILGRSDDTLKVAGKRVGPAEVESILVGHMNVAEAAVIGVPDEIKGTAMIAFCVLRNAGDPPAMSEKRENSSRTSEISIENSTADDESSETDRFQSLEKELKALIAKEMGKPLQPNRIHFVSALPKTRNAKVMRRVIRSAYLGEDAGDLSALENPNTVEEIGNIGNN
jgi:acetyl-CoA synthetase